MKYLNFILLFCIPMLTFSNINNEAQERFLINNFSISKNNEEKLRSSLDLFYFYKENLNDLNKAKPYLYEAQSISNKSKLGPEFEIELLRAFGWKFFEEKNYIDAFSNFDKAVRQAFSKDIDSSYIKAKLDLAELYTKIRNYYVAEITLNECLVFFYKNQKYLDIGKTYSKKSQLAIFRREYNNSQYFSTKAINYFKELNEIRLLINEYNNLGYTFQMEKNYDSSLKYYKIAQELALKNELEQDFPFIAGNISYIMFQKGDIENAYNPMYFDYINSLKQNDYGSATNSLIYLAKINIIRGKIDSARLQLDIAWQSVQNLQSIPTYYDYFETRSELMNRQNKSDSAYYYIKLSVKYMDSFRVEGNKLNAKMALFNHKVDLEMAKNEIEEKSAELKTLMRILILPISLILLFALYSFIYANMSKKRIQNLTDRAQIKDQKIEELENQLMLEKLKNEINKK